MLGFAVNTGLMRAMDRLGCGVSYTQIAEIDTALAVPSKAGRIPDGRGIAKKHLPGCIHHASIGNIDRSKGTTSGEGKSLRVNGMAVQPRIN